MIEKNKGDINELKKSREDLETLKELDVIYKQIYDRGYKPALANKLNRYKLAPGYDMSSNTALLTRTKSKIESLEKIIKDNKQEISKLKKYRNEAHRLIKPREWGAYLFGKRV